MTQETGCILVRLGNKRRIARHITPHFPERQLYVEPFFGAGGMFFNKLKAQYNLLNDKDEEVYNLWNVVVNQCDELIELWGRLPIDQKLFMYWKRRKESDPVRRALRFLFLSNFGYMGKPTTMRVFTANTKRNVFERIRTAQRTLADCEVLCQDFRKVLQLTKGSKQKKQAFVYCDPPYLETTNNYNGHGFTEQDSRDLFTLLDDCGVKWAMSEFDHPFIMEQAMERKLNIHVIGERHNIGNRRTEILLTNYKG